MDGFLRALGFESKPEFTDKIPDNLTKDCFNVHNTFHHGFSSQPICLGYDSVQQLLAVGTEHGAVLLLGKPGLERHIMHPTKVAVGQMQFITNKGLLVTSCDNNTLYLWNLKEKLPCVLHSLEFTSEKPTTLYYVYGSEWLYVGTDTGNVHLVHIQTFKLSGLTIYWNNAIELSCRTKPGDVISIQEHPLDQGKVLIAFSCGKCVLFDMKAHSERHYPSATINSGGGAKDLRADPHKRFNYDPGSDHILTSVNWLGNGKAFACSYSDGSIVMWSPKCETKPEKIFYVHEADPSAFKPVYKMQLVYTENEAWIVCSGGYPEGNDLAPRTLTILRGKNPPRVLSSETTILDFICLPSSPYASDCQKPFALVILAKNELILHDLEQPDYPRYPNYLLPYALDIHLPPVTFLHYCANCPDELIASLHSVKSKLMKTSAKPWPLKGGKWGQEVPHTSTDLILTGHLDGSVRLWYCSSVILQPFFTLSTGRYFKMQYQPSPSSSPDKKVPPPRPPPPLALSQKSNSTVAAKIASTKIPFSPTKSLPEIVKSEKGKVGDSDKESSEGSPTKASPSPTTGQQEVYPANSTDGAATTLEGSQTPKSERRLVQSHERKSIFKKKKNKNTPDNSPRGSRTTTPVPDGSESPPQSRASPTKGHRLQVSSGKEEKKGFKLSKKSFRKVAKVVRISRSISKDRDKDKDKSKRDSVDEQDGEVTPSGAVASIDCEDESKESTSESHRKRPQNIPLQPESQFVFEPSSSSTGSGSKQTVNTPMIQGPARLPSSGSDDFIHITTPLSEPSLTTKMAPNGARSLSPKFRKSSKLPTLNRVSEVESDTPSSPLAFTVKAPFSSQFIESDDFFPITNIRMCVFGLWLCVSNKGGAVLAFDFQLNEQTKPPQAIEINFDSDSIIRQYAGPATSHAQESNGSSSTSSSYFSPPSSPVGQWVFEDKVQDSLPGFQLSQLCSCYHYSGPKKGKGGPKRKVPAKVSTLQYSVDIGLLAIGTNRGFALIDIEANTCLYVLSCLTSILYMADPSKFTRQIRLESRSQVPLKKALVKRHSTFHALRVATRGSTPTSPVKRAGTSRSKSQPRLSLSDVENDDMDDDCFDDQEMTVSELECSVTALEVVQLQLDKHTPPTLTLWVGLASGYVVSYGIDVLKRADHFKQRRKIELIPTKFITETKSPIVAVYFLNEWGDCQVIPYQPNRTNLAGTPEHQAVHKSSGKAKGKQTPNALEHYAIIVSEDKLRSFSFPGFTKISVCSLPLSDGCAILRSEYFTCNDLPCLLSLTSNKSLFVHSLPGLKQLINIPFNALSDTLSMCTFHISGHGQAIYMSSASELQRLSVVTEDKLNLPRCLPDLFVKMADPDPYQGGVGKRILEALFASAPTTVNRELLFGETARRPVGNLYRLDGKSGTAYVGKRDKDKEEQRLRAGKEGGGHPHHKGASTGVAGQLEKNVHALHERKEKLSQIEQRTAEVAQQASDYASLATRLRQKYES